jgi:hypothetical protein
MYLWNTKALATELRDGTLTERERMKYYLLFMTLLAVVTELQLYGPEPVTPTLIATSVLSIVATVVGIHVTYRANRSGDDRDFIARSVCLIVPVGVRVLAASIAIYVAYMMVGLMIGGDAFDQFTAHTTWVDVVFFCVVEVVLYWRLWHHFTWIARPHDPA